MKTNLFRLTAIGLAAFLVGCATPTSDNGGSVITPPPAPVVTYLFSSAGTTGLTSAIDNWGSGTTIDSAFAADATLTPVIKLTNGTGWGPVSAMAFTNIAPTGSLSQFTSLTFKVKTADYTKIKVKFPGSSLAAKEVEYTIASGTALAGGWTEMTVPFSDFVSLSATEDQVGIFSFGAGQLLLTDIGFKGEAPVTTAGLNAAITAAQALQAATVVGSADGNVSQSAHDAFAAAISAAQAAPVTTWAQVNSALSALATATTTFKASILHLVPTDLPAAPALAAANVISLLNSSGTYTDVAVGDWNPNWGQGGSISDFVVATKTIKKVNLVNYQGINVSVGGNVGAAGVIDASSKSTLHISYWSANGTAFKLFPINATGEAPVTVTASTHNAWTDVEIDLTAAGIDLSTIRQLKFDVAGSGGSAGIYFLDNIYFH